MLKTSSVFYGLPSPRPVTQDRRDRMKYSRMFQAVMRRRLTTPSFICDHGACECVSGDSSSDRPRFLIMGREAYRRSQGGWVVVVLVVLSGRFGCCISSNR